MKYKVLIMAVLMLGGLSFISCNQQGKSQQATEAARSEDVPEEEDIKISKDKDWSERMLVFKVCSKKRMVMKSCTKRSTDKNYKNNNDFEEI